MFGNLKAMESEVSKILREHFFLRRKVELGTEPKLYYLL
jgi:molybdopterin-containing oxidoreductase family iron-sulfur binding subunit